MNGSSDADWAVEGNASAEVSDEKQMGFQPRLTWMV
jgi:hypothetical protein